MFDLTTRPKYVGYLLKTFAQPSQNPPN